MKRLSIWMMSVLVVAITLAFSPNPAISQSAKTLVTGAGGAAFPSGASFNGISITGLNFGIGVRLAGDGTARGVFSGALLNTSANPTQEITLDGHVTAGSLQVPGTATFSGTCSVDMGDGTPLLLSVPLTATVSIASDGTQTLKLVVGTTTLPVATANLGVLTIQ